MPVLRTWRKPAWPALLLVLLAGLISMPASAAEPVAPLGINLEQYDYPAPVQTLALDTPVGPAHMAYMDIPPTSAADQPPVIVLMHGKNFSGAYWGDTAAWLADRGWRVIVPDQIGFGKSDKPRVYSYSFAHLAANTHALLDKLDIEHATVLGHSMGGMLATRYALMYPDQVDHLILVDPIGLEDWKAKGVPYRGMSAWYAREMKKDYAGIRAYQEKSYYHGTWRSAYDPWARMLAGMYASEDKPRLAWVSAATYDMIYNEPVVYEFDDLAMPVTLMIGALDRTALGKDLVAPALAEQLGDYPALGRSAVAAMPDARLVVFDGLGHLPFIEAPEVFRAALAHSLEPAADTPETPDSESSAEEESP